MNREDINLYEFYREVVLRYQREQLGIAKMSSARNDHLHKILGELQTEYFQSGAINYGDPDRMVAYTLSFAPKHALIWRELGKRFTLQEDENEEIPEWNLNSIGPGPGSDLIGMLCGLPRVESVKVSVVGLEEEESWRLLFEIAREEFTSRTGINFDAIMTNDPRNLLRDGQTIGSFVLSDAARSGTLRGLLTDLKSATNGEEAWFLDFPSYTCATNGKTYVNAAVSACGPTCKWSFLPDMDLGIHPIIASQIDGCNPIYCKRNVREEPKVNFITVKLR